MNILVFDEEEKKVVVHIKDGEVGLKQSKERRHSCTVQELQNSEEHAPFSRANLDPAMHNSAAHFLMRRDCRISDFELGMFSINSSRKEYAVDLMRTVGKQRT